MNAYMCDRCKKAETHKNVEEWHVVEFYTFKAEKEAWNDIVGVVTPGLPYPYIKKSTRHFCHDCWLGIQDVMTTRPATAI